MLGIGPDADEDEIKKAYRKAALKYHPDKQVDKEKGWMDGYTWNIVRACRCEGVRFIQRVERTTTYARNIILYLYTGSVMYLLSAYRKVRVLPFDISGCESTLLVLFILCRFIV